MKTCKHDNFNRLNKDDLMFNEVNDKIAVFAEFAKSNMPDHVAGFVLIVSRDGYITNTIENKIEATNEL